MRFAQTSHSVFEACGEPGRVMVLVCAFSYYHYYCMGLRFRKRVKIAPGITLNFSKSGISTTVGVRGASVNFGKNGTYINTGIPGTGLYMRERVGSNKMGKVTEAQLQLKENHKNSNRLKSNYGVIVACIFLYSLIFVSLTGDSIISHIGIYPFLLIIIFLSGCLIYFITFSISHKRKSPESSINNACEDVSNKDDENTENNMLDEYTDIVNKNMNNNGIKEGGKKEKEEKNAFVLNSVQDINDDNMEEQQPSFNLDIPYNPKLELPDYQYPTLDLLEHYHNDLPDSDIIAQNAKKERIIRALSSFDIEVNTIRANVGAVVTLYEITLADGISIRKIYNIEEDLALTLAVDSVRITPIPSRGTIGIEIPNEKRGIVSIESVLNSKEFMESHMELPCAIGKTLTNDVFMIDLAKAPHILVAGSTGQGKSVFIDTIITSLLYKKHPSELKFVLIDSRKVQLSLYEAIENQYLARLEDSNESIITDASSAISTLDSLCELMENRYKMLRAAKVRNIKEYNEKFRARQLSPLSGFEFLPYYVVIIDEYGDLIYYNKDEFEKSISRLAKLGRATGIHLIISTQRPTVNIVTGEIKEIFPTRVAFKVPSSTDSHIILDMPGANQLMGRGDMLYLQNDNPVRVQCAYVDTYEVERICRFINAQQKFPESTYLPNPYIDYDERGTIDVDMHNLDPMFADVARMVVSQQAGSTSNIQRQFSIGYNRAGKLMDQLECAGVVGPQIGSKPREVLIQDLMSLESLFQNIGVN